MSRFLALLLSLAMLGGRADGRSQQDASTPDSLSVREYFRDTLSLVDKAGVRRAIQVSLTQWSLTGGLDVARFPQRGLLVVQLGGGDVTTIIGKRRQDRRVGEFWTVAPDSGMGVKTKDDQVILDVFAVSEEPSRRTRE
jgi:hypothetical protein